MLLSAAVDVDVPWVVREGVFGVLWQALSFCCLSAVLRCEVWLSQRAVDPSGLLKVVAMLIVEPVQLPAVPWYGHLTSGVNQTSAC